MDWEAPAGNAAYTSVGDTAGGIFSMTVKGGAPSRQLAPTDKINGVSFWVLHANDSGDFTATDTNVLTNERINAESYRELHTVDSIDFNAAPDTSPTGNVNCETGCGDLPAVGSVATRSVPRNAESNYELEMEVLPGGHCGMGRNCTLQGRETPPQKKSSNQWAPFPTK